MIKLFNQLIHFLFFAFLIFQATVFNHASAQSNIVPALREWKASGENLSLRTNFNIVIDKNYSSQLKEAIELFAEDLKSITSLKPIVLESSNYKPGDIFFTIDNKEKIYGDEGYVLEAGESIVVKAANSQGIFYGTQTLLQIFNQSGKSIETGRGLDYPNYSTRSIMMDVGRKYFQMDYLEKTIRQLAWYKMNVLHLHFSEWSAFRLKSDKYPGLAAKESYSKQDIRRLQDVAKKYHVMIVPEIDLPAHATAISEFNPDLGFKCESMRKARWQGEEANNAGKAWTLDVTRPEVRKWIKDLLDEFIPLFDAPYFHVGGDEYQYDPEKLLCPELVQAMKAKGYTQPGDIFIEWLNEVNEQVKSYGKAYSDMELVEFQ
jgi:N-acetyl-beta-hexosaminidase